MKRATEWMFAPWRDDYTRGNADKSEGCPFCKVLREGRPGIFPFLIESEHAFAVMNAFPYNGGHSLVLPKRHVGELDALSGEEYDSLFRLVRKVVDATSAALQPSGFNVGINLGRSGGGGIPSHIHVHIVPRWHADTNFMNTIANTNVVSTDLKKDFELILENLSK